MCCDQGFNIAFRVQADLPPPPKYLGSNHSTSLQIGQVAAMHTEKRPGLCRSDVKFEKCFELFELGTSNKAPALEIEHPQ
jgi:hypothetical protein